MCGQQRTRIPTTAATRTAPPSALRGTCRGAGRLHTGTLLLLAWLGTSSCAGGDPGPEAGDAGFDGRGGASGGSSTEAPATGVEEASVSRDAGAADGGQERPAADGGEEGPATDAGPGAGRESAAPDPVDASSQDAAEPDAALAPDGAAADAGPDGSEGQPYPPYAHFESPQTHPLRLSPDGSRLFAANTEASRISVFSLDDPAAPQLVAEIPVGLEPVSLWPASNDEVWVVNHVSDSVSIVSVSRGLVLATLPAGDEPSDIVFAGSPPRAYVTASRDKALRIFDPEARELMDVVPLEGEHPRALAVSPDGATIYVTFALSGNRTTVVPRELDPPPEPAVAGLPPAPRVALIIDATDPEWTTAAEGQTPVIQYTLLDHDVAEIDATSQTVRRYVGGVGTVNLGLAVSPATGSLFVANMEALNLVFFEPALRGHFVDNRITRVVPGDEPEVTPFDLNPDVDYTVLPNPSALATALAYPTAVAFEPDGDHLWVAALGTDRIARVNAAGFVVSRVDLGGAPPAEAELRGPRGLALSSAGDYLYVQNSISGSLSTLDLSTLAVVDETPIGTLPPMPARIRRGRGLLYDARLSGNGTASCASCHVDGQTDNLAWNLGNPEGQMMEVIDPVSGEPIVLHPMKGPMVTQPLAGLAGTGPFHWRGDMPDLHAFNRAFPALMGGAELPAADMDALVEFMESIMLPPNPYLQLDGSFADEVLGGSPAAGLEVFRSPIAGLDGRTCADCHSLPWEPFRLQITRLREDQLDAKVPLPRLAYRKLGFPVNEPGATGTLGFGARLDGSRSVHQITAELGADITSFVLSWDTGTAPTVGRTLTLPEDAGSALGAEAAEVWSTLHERARAGANGLLLHGEIDGVLAGLVYAPAEALYRSCGIEAAGLYTEQELLEMLEQSEAAFSVMGILPGIDGCAILPGPPP